MEPLFSEKQLQDMSKENIIALMQAMQAHRKKQEAKIQLLEEKMKELEFMNALLSDRLTLAQRKRFGSSSEKYADGYTQMNLFNEAEQEADPAAAEPEMEEIHPKSYKRKKKTGKKEEDLPSFETTEIIEHKLEGGDRFCSECGTKYKAVTAETVKYLKFVPARFEVVEESRLCLQLSGMRGNETPTEGTSADEGKCCDALPGCRHYECQICQRDAACTSGEGIRRI